MNNGKLISSISSFESFAEEVAEQVNRKTAGKASICSNVKNNGVIKIGIKIKKEDKNIEPVLYLEEAYEKYSHGETVEQISDNILTVYDELLKQPFFDEIPDFEKLDSLKESIFFKIVNTKKNKEMLSKCPHLNVLDLSVTFYISVGFNSNGVSAVLIRNEQSQKWGVSAKELMKTACSNSEKSMPAVLSTMRENLEGIMLKHQVRNLLHGNAGDRDEMYILTNEMKSYGAGCIFYPGMLDKVGDVIGEDYYIIPSSLHETILIPVSMSPGEKEIDEMVREVNTAQVLEEEILSDHCYKYSRIEKTIC